MPPKRKPNPSDLRADDSEYTPQNSGLTNLQTSQPTTVPSKRRKSARTNSAATKDLAATVSANASSDQTLTQASEAQDESLKKVVKPRTLEKNRANSAERKIDELKTKVSNLTSRLDQEVRKVKSFEIKQLAASGQNKSYFQDDQCIQGNVSQLFEMINKWVLNWSHSGNLMSELNESDVNKVIKMLRGESKYLQPAVLREAAGERCMWATAGCRIVTEAFLTHSIARQFLIRPFHGSLGNTSDGNADMEEYVRRVCDGTKGTQIEANLLVSTISRAHYSPDQYADNIITPIIGDRFVEDRNQLYDSLINEWLSQKDSPLSPLLRPCQDSEVEFRTKRMTKILQAASKLSLQLWVQNCKVEVVDNITSGEDMHSLLNDGVATLHPLSPPDTNPAGRRGRRFDILVWPRVQVVKYDPVYPDICRAVSTKASVVVYSSAICKANKRELESKAGTLLRSAVPQALLPLIPSQQSVEGMVECMAKTVIHSLQDLARGDKNESIEEAKQLSLEVPAMESLLNDKKSRDDPPSTEPGVSASNKTNIERVTTTSEGSDRTVIDLTDDPTTCEAPTKCQEVSETAAAESSQPDRLLQISRCTDCPLSRCKHENATSAHPPTPDLKSDQLAEKDMSAPATAGEQGGEASIGANDESGQDIDKSRLDESMTTSDDAASVAKSSISLDDETITVSGDGTSVAEAVILLDDDTIMVSAGLSESQGWELHGLEADTSHSEAMKFLAAFAQGEEE